MNGKVWGQYIVKKEPVGAGNFKGVMIKEGKRIARFDCYSEAVEIAAILNKHVTERQNDAK